MHDAYICGHSENNIKCVPIWDRRIKQLLIIAIFCRITGFTSDFLSFIVVEHIRFVHGALYLRFMICMYCVLYDLSLYIVVLFKKVMIW